MNNTLHTDGPWAIHTCNENGPFLDSFYLSTLADDNECERIICRFPTGTGQFFDMGRENLANAHLISAAPDLLQVVADYVLLCDLHDYVGAVPDAAREALRKAKGEA
jgi:hypothetical protein